MLILACSRITRNKPLLLNLKQFSTSNKIQVNFNNLNKSDRKPFHERNEGRFNMKQLGNSDSYQLSDKVKQFSKNNQLDLASDLVKNSVNSNIIVWNILINEYLYVGKFKGAYELWTDMKRRGLIPTSRSYSTMFSGYGKMKEIEDASLARIKTIYAQWLIYADRRIDEDKSSRREFGVELDEISCVPTNAYLTFLGNTKKYDLLLETFEAMPTSGPLAADSMSYSIVLAALRNSDDPTHFPLVMNLWKKMSDNLMTIDVKTVSIIISFCREAAKRPDDQRIGLDVAKEFYGLVDPAEEDLLVSTKLARPRVIMDSAAFSNVLSLCIATQQFNLAVRWFDQVRDYPKRFGRNLLEHYHCNLMMVALAYKKDATAAEDLINWMRRSSKSLYPTLASYTCAFQVYWRAADLNRALKLVTLMTSPPLPSIQSETPKPLSLLPVLRDPSARPSTTILSQPSIFQPDSRIASTLLQTALATRDRGEIYKTIELIEKFGFGQEYYNTQPSIPLISYSKYDTTISSTANKSTPSPESVASTPPFDPHATHTPSINPSHVAFWKYKLSEVSERALERVLQGGENHLEKTRRRELAIWRGDVVSWLDSQEQQGVGKSVRAKEIGQAGEEGIEDLGVKEESMRGRREIVKEREMKRQLKFINEKKRKDKEEAESGRELYKSDIGLDSRRSSNFSNGSNSNNSFSSGRRNFDERNSEDRTDSYSSRTTRISDPKEQLRLREAKVESWPSHSPSGSSKYSPLSAYSRERSISSLSSRSSYGNNSRPSRYDSSPSYNSSRDRDSDRNSSSRFDRAPRNNFSDRNSGGGSSGYGNRSPSSSSSSGYGQRKEQSGNYGRDERGGGRGGGDSRGRY